MYLHDLYDCVSTIEEVRVIGREFSAYGTDYALVGLVNTNESTELVFLEYDERSADNDCCAEPENLTNREFALADKYVKKGLFDLINEVVVNNNSFDVLGMHGCTLDCGMDSDIYVIAEFMKHGWISEEFFNYPPECVSISFIELEEKLESLAQFDLSKQIKLVAYEEYKEEFPQITLNLPVEQDIDKKVSLFDGEDEICIKRVHLVDLYEQEGIDKMDIQSICPKNMRIPVIEYTCDDECCFEISLSSYLDGIFGNACNGFETDDGVVGIAIGIPSTKGEKFFTIQQAVKADIKQIDCEFVRCSKEIENPDIKEFLI